MSIRWKEKYNVKKIVAIVIVYDRKNSMFHY